MSGGNPGATKSDIGVFDILMPDLGRIEMVPKPPKIPKIAQCCLIGEFFDEETLFSEYATALRSRKRLQAVVFIQSEGRLRPERYLDQ